MILMHRLITDVQGFNETQFGIFNDTEYKDLLILWEVFANKNPNRFIAQLSPDQKLKVVTWAIERTEYSVADMVIALDKFLKMLKKLPDKQKYPVGVVQRNKKSIFRK